MSDQHAHALAVEGGLPYAMTLELMNRFQEPEVLAALAELPLPAGSHGLDVGCGVGLYAQWLANAIGPDGHILAIDHNPERVQDTIQRLQGTTIANRISVQEGNGTALG